MDFQNYFSPDSVSGQIVVRLLHISFIIWFASICAYSVYLAGLWRKLRNDSGDLKPLSNFLIRYARSSIKNPTPSEQKRTRKEASDAFVEFCKDKLISENSPIASHIKAIFDAGWQENRLDTSELIKHTSGKLFALSNFLKSVLTLFLIVGLFGTLMGLAESFGNLSSFASKDQYTSQTQQEFTGAVRNLLMSLKGAFAPSLLGIVYTVIGVFIFSVFIAVFSRLKSDLESLTLTIWVPELFATKTLRNKFEAAETVAQFAKGITGFTKDFSDKLETANGSLDKLTAASTGLTNHTEEFVKGVAQISSFELKLHDLYQQMVDESGAFHDNVKTNLKHLSDTQDNTSKILESQGNQIEQLFNGLKIYEESYIKERKEIDLGIKEVLVAARNSYSGIVQRNNELITRIGDPLRTELVSKIGEINQTLNSKLSGIQKKFEDFDAPIVEAAEKIGATLDTVLTRTDEINREFHVEFVEQTKNYTDQLEEIKNINDRIVKLLGDVNSSTGQQTAQLAQSYNAINSLSASIDSLNRTVTIGETKEPTASNNPNGSPILGVTQLNEKSITYEPFREILIALSLLFSIKPHLTIF